MSTRSSITVRLRGGTYRSVYCHFDGYTEGPDGVGWKLQKHYNSQERAEEVTSLGALSILGESCEAPFGHSFETPVPGYTVAYHRDRKEHWLNCSPGVGATVEEALAHSAGPQEFDYLWDGTHWTLIGDEDPAVVMRYTARGEEVSA